MEPCPVKYKLPRRLKIKFFIPPPYCRKANKGNHEEVPSLKLWASDPSRILHLVEDLTDWNTCALEIKINLYLQKELEALTVFLINLLPASEEAVVQVLGDQVLDCALRMRVCENLFKTLFKKKDDCLEECDIDERLQELIKIVLENIKEDLEVMTIPILSHYDNSEGCPSRQCTVPILVCVVNSPKEKYFLTSLVQETFRYCLTILINTSTSEEEARLKRQCQSLLAVARRLFSHLGDLSDLLKEIMVEAKALTNAERCSLFLLDPDHMHLVAKVFDGHTAKEQSQVRIYKDQGIAGHVAATGKILNIRDAYTHPLFYKGIDQATGFKTKNILCFPIRDENGIVGVAQLCNKLKGDFDYFDEEVAMAFSIYCGLSIMHSLVYKKIQDAQARTKLSNELMMYHMKINNSDVLSVLQCKALRHAYADYEYFSFSPRRILVKEMTCQLLKMFEDLKFIEKFHIKKDVLVRFLLYVEKGYRDTPYHNWSHAFSVAHFAYLCLVRFKLVEEGYITDLEALAFFISAICHDLDHRGTTNSFQLKTGSTLACLYSSEGSVMERHHLAQTYCTLNTENCNFLESLSSKDYMRLLDVIKDLILATDLVSHLHIVARQYEMATKGYDRSSGEHRYLLLFLLMTCSDLSDQTKAWPISKEVAKSIYDEFFQQGDLEKAMGNEPVEMMDREKASIPHLQIQFLQDVCLPVYKILSMMFPIAKELVETLKQNIEYWEASKKVFEEGKLEGKSSMEILKDPELVDKVNEILEGASETT